MKNLWILVIKRLFSDKILSSTPQILRILRVFKQETRVFNFFLILSEIKVWQEIKCYFYILALILTNTESICSDKIKCILSSKTWEIEWKQYFSSLRDVLVLGKIEMFKISFFLLCYKNWLSRSCMWPGSCDWKFDIQDNGINTT